VFEGDVETKHVLASIPQIAYMSPAAKIAGVYAVKFKPPLVVFNTFAAAPPIQATFASTTETQFNE